MTDQITVPRETWDAMREALESVGKAIPAGQSTVKTCYAINNMHRDAVQAALTAANAVSHPKPETAPVTEGLAITSESVLALLVKEMRYIATITNGPAHRIAMMTLEKVAAANAVRPLADISEVPRTEHEYSIKLGTLQPQAQGEAKTYEPSRQRVVMACDILDRIKEAHENWGGWSGTPSSCDAAINLLRYPANMPVNAAQPQATEPAGYKLVPVEPTREMLYAIQNDCDILPPRGKRIWAAMLAAAPEAKQ